MSEDELRALAQASPEDRNTAFLKSWVVREARLKAQGKGIWSGPGTSAETSLTHRLFAPAPNFIAAVAAPRAGWRLYTCAMKE
jgi:phosphopantetheinyl transferase